MCLFGLGLFREFSVLLRPGAPRAEQPGKQHTPGVPDDGPPSFTMRIRHPFPASHATNKQDTAVNQQDLDVKKEVQRLQSIMRLNRVIEENDTEAKNEKV